jgi:hypothetical protein
MALFCYIHFAVLAFRFIPTLEDTPAVAGRAGFASGNYYFGSPPPLTTSDVRQRRCTQNGGMHRT